MFNKLKEFKDMRDQAKELQAKLAAETVTVNGSGGKVVMTMNGTLEMVGLAIDPELLSPDKKSKLEEAIKEAHRDALKQMQRIMAMKMKEMGGLPNIPGLG